MAFVHVNSIVATGNKQNISFKFDVLTAPGILSIRSPIKASMSTNCDGCKPPNLSWKSSRPKDTILQTEDVHESFWKASQQTTTRKTRAKQNRRKQAIPNMQKIYKHDSFNNVLYFRNMIHSIKFGIIIERDTTLEVFG